MNWDRFNKEIDKDNKIFEQQIDKEKKKWVADLKNIVESQENTKEELKTNKNGFWDKILKMFSDE